MQLSAAQQEAFIRFLEGLVITAVITGLYTVVPMFSVGATPDWHTIASIFGSAVIYSLAMGLWAYAKAHKLVVVDSVPPAPAPAMPGSPLVVIHTAPVPQTSEPAPTQEPKQ